LLRKRANDLAGAIVRAETGADTGRRTALTTSSAGFDGSIVTTTCSIKCMRSAGAAASGVAAVT
jgi:hypothetical protein